MAFDKKYFEDIWGTLAVFTWWSKDSFFHVPTDSQALPDGFWFNPQLLTPLSNGKVIAVGFIASIIASVKRLLFDSRPLAVFRSVVPVIIYPIQTMFRAGSEAHICYKSFKSTPFRTNLNPPSSIIRILLRFRIFASLVHSLKTVILRAIPKSVFVSEVILAFLKTHINNNSISGVQYAI